MWKLASLALVKKLSIGSILFGILLWFGSFYMNYNLAVRCTVVDTNKEKSSKSQMDIHKNMDLVTLNHRSCFVDSGDWDSVLDRVMAGNTGALVSPDDPALIQIIRDYFIDLPRPFITKYSRHVMETPQSKDVLEILKNKKNGFFVECGALDGERSSNTLFLEQSMGWNGLLVEMDPSYYLQIRGKNRKCYTANACLSPHTFPSKMQFREHAMGQGRLITDPKHIQENIKYVYDTYCLPLYSLMLALNRTQIDYLSLDVEGFEMPILKAIPFDKLDISVLTVEYKHGSKQEQLDFMREKGYRMVKLIKYSNHDLYMFGSDFLYVKESLFL